MSQTAAPQAAPPPASAQAPVAAPVGQRPATQQQPELVDTPSLLNRWQLIGVTTVILFGLLSALVQLSSWQSDGRAADDTEQLVRVQEIQSSLLRADALATNAFLVGGLEDTDQRAEYDAAIESALRLVADAADAQSADREALAALNVEVADYATAVAQARDYNRLGYPVGAEYLSGASEELRADALPILQALVSENTERAEGAMGGQHPFWLLLLGVLALAVLWWINRNLAQHFRRRFNKGVALAGVIVAVVTVVTVAAALLGDRSNDRLRDGAFATAVSEANARTAANDAKANESLRLIKRGSGESFEEKWVASAEVVRASATGSTAALWDDYVAQHEAIVALDREGKWEQAVRRATGTAEGGSTAALDAFDRAAKEVVATNGDTATEDLGRGRALALVVALLTLGLGAVAAVAVARGINERRREYA